MSSDALNEDGNDNSTTGIHRLNKNKNKILIEEEAEDVYWGLQEKIGALTLATTMTTTRTTQ